MGLGADRVRAGFNPSKDSLVDQIKGKTAELIDLCNGGNPDAPGDPSDEEVRLWRLAMTAYEEAAMWAVKAATIAK
jgi:hypothetical protein